MRALAIMLATTFLPAVGFAEDTTGTFEVQDAKLCTSVADKMPAGEKSDFSTGEQVYVWLKLSPKNEGATLQLRWSLNGNPVWTMDPAPVKLGRTWYYKTIDQPGDWKVEVLDNNQALLHTVTFKATGEPTVKVSAPAKADAPAATAEPLTPGESDKVAVVDLKLSETIQDREAVGPSTSFKAGAKVYTWLKLDVKATETTIKVRWLLDDKPVFTSDPVNVKQSPGWRTWLFKTVDAAGSWKVEVVDADDKLVKSESFSVQ